MYLASLAHRRTAPTILALKALTSPVMKRSVSRVCLVVCLSQPQASFPLFIDNQEGAIQVFNSRLAVIKRLDSGKASLIERATTDVDMMPALRITRASDPLMKNIQIPQPSPMDEFSLPGDMAMKSISRWTTARPSR